MITGSTRYELLPRATQSLTGRATVLPVWPLSQVELDEGPAQFVADLLAALDVRSLVEGHTT